MDTTGFLSQSQIEEIRTAFEAFDHDGNGTVDARELVRIMKACEQNPTTAQIQQVIDDVDRNGDGSLEFSEFLNLMKDIYKDPVQFEEEIKEAFGRYDKDGNGKINQTELRHLLTSFGDKFSDDEVQEMMDGLGADPDGNISYEAFAKLLCDT